MKNFLSAILAIAFLTPIFSQNIQEITTGTGYRKQSFLKLSTGVETIVADNLWDIAFTTQGLQDAGIFLNESSGTSMGVAQARVQAFSTFSDVWTDAIDPDGLKDFEILNDEKTWSWGAFNAGRDETSPFDFGWGKYNPATNSVLGSKVFCIKLRDGSFKKLQIQSLIGTTYTFRYANLDGSGEVVKTINKADHSGRTLAYFSFTTGAVAAVEPAGGFDLFYARYVSPIWDPASQQYLNYNVTGIQHAPKMATAKAVNIDPKTVSFESYRDSLKTKLDLIGHDWKAFTGAAWTIDETRVYFVKTADNHIWKIQFIDFEGSTTGTAVFEKADLGLISTHNLGNSLAQFEIFPNPVGAEANVVLNLNENVAAGDAYFNLTDAAGRTVFTRSLNLQSGLNGLVLPMADVPAGVYFLNLNVGGELLSRKLVKN